MTLTINGKTYKLYFGLDFIAHLDQKYFVMQGGFQFGQGLNVVYTHLESGNPTILPELIQAATITEETPPTEEEIIKYIDEDADVEKVMTDFLSALETASTTKLMMKKMKTDGTQMQEMLLQKLAEATLKKVQTEEARKKTQK